MTLPRSRMTPEQHARADANNARRRDLAPGNPTYRLDDDSREQLAYLAHMHLWPKVALGRAYGVTAKTVDACMERHVRKVRA